jgi:hypothetical protein
LKDIGEYFRFTSNGLLDLQNTIMGLQAEQGQLMAMVGLNQAKVAQYAQHLGAFMQELVFDSDISIEEVKRSIELKTSYL